MGSALTVGRPFVLLSLALLTASAFGQSVSTEQDLYRRIDALVAADRLRQNSNATRSKGAQDQLGRGFREQRFPLALPVGNASFGANDESGTGTPNVWPLWPNMARTNAIRVTAHVIEGGSGSWKDLSGKDIRGQIVLMNFNSGDNWKNVAALGGAAVVFRAPKDTHRVQAEAKFAWGPIGIPRFYTNEPHTFTWLGGGTLQCDQRWVQTNGRNLILDLPGGDPQQLIQLTAHTDVASVVPGVAPGAESRASLAALMEAVRVLQTLPRKRALRIALLDGHFQALAGARALAQDILAGREMAPLLSVSLDLNSEVPNLGVFGRGWFYEIRDEAMDPMRILTRTMRQQAEDMAGPLGLPNARTNLLDTINHSDGRPWRNAMPGKFAFDNEPFVQIGLNAITLATTDAQRQYVDTPLDTADRVNWENLRSQTVRIVCYLYRLLNDPLAPQGLELFRVNAQPRTPVAQSLTTGFATLTGKVVTYDPKKGFVPDQPVSEATVFALGRQKTMMGVRGDIVAMSETDGTYRIEGVPTINCYRDMYKRPVTLAAFRADEQGRITHACAEGVNGSQDYPNRFPVNAPFRSSPLVVFPCSSVDFFGLTDPQDLGTLGLVQVLDPATDGQPQKVGWFSPEIDLARWTTYDNASSIFLPESAPFRALFGKDGETRAVLRGPYSSDSPRPFHEERGQGTRGRILTKRGYQVDSPSARRVGLFSLAAARDMISLNEERLSLLTKQGIESPALAEVNRLSQNELAQAEKAAEKADWQEAQGAATRAWGYALRAYPGLIGTANDIVGGVLFYLLLLVPFAVFVERLLISSRNLVKQAITTLVIFFGGFLALRFLHPAFAIVPNPSIVFVAFIMGGLSAVVIAFVVGKYEEGLRADRRARTGVRDVDVRRASVASAAIGLAMGNLRRRRTRTILSAGTLVIMTLVMLALSGLTPNVQVVEMPHEGKAPYEGILLRNPGLEPLARGAESVFDGVGLPERSRRVTYWGYEFTGGPNLQAVADNGKTADVRVLLGLDSPEGRLVAPQSALIEGRWIKPGEQDVILLPRPMADALGSPKTVKIGGGKFTVIGVLDVGKLNALQDLDTDGFMPPDMILSRQSQERNFTATKAFRSFIRLDASQVCILPADQVLEFGGDVRSIAALTPQGDTRAILQSLMPRLRLNLYAGVDGRIFQFGSKMGTSATGLGLALLQLVLAAVFVLNSMMASVYERRGEIGIYSAVGLAPNHIAAVFFAEAAVLGVLGVVTGYLIAQAGAKLMHWFALFPDLHLNFSSSASVGAAVLVLATAVLSAVFPARIARRIAAPAQDQQLPPPASEDVPWEVQLPFRLDPSEVPAAMTCFQDWFRGYERYQVGEFLCAETSGGTDGVRTTVWLAPYDLGVSQQVHLEARPAAVPDVMELFVQLDRQGGEFAHWVKLNEPFLAAVRRQFLAWRG